MTTWIKIIVFLSIIPFASCKKFLDTKSNQIYSTPSTLKDLRALLDDPYFGRRGAIVTQISSDDYYLLPSTYQATRTFQQDGYAWNPTLDNPYDWQNQYSNVLTANTVLDHLEEIEADGQVAEFNEIKGAALFFRALCFFQLAQIYAPQYDPATAKSDLGIVLRLDANFNKQSARSTVEETYNRIIEDLKVASELLPVVTKYNTRPGRPAAFGLLARTYLQIGDYARARQAADDCLQLYSFLMDYNDPAQVDTLGGEPFKNLNKANKEIIFYQNEDGSIMTYDPSGIVDSNLYSMYEVNDIRRAAFFMATGTNTYWFRGSYNGSMSVGAFVGIGTAEIFLIRAEVNARLGNKDAALQDLNRLLEKRYVAATFTPKTAANANDALTLVLNERRKEMAFRGMRWADLKRLNKDAATAITLKRNIDGQILTLPPNDLRYALLIPVNVIQMTNLPQNAR